MVIIDVQNYYFYDGPGRLYEPEKAEAEIKKVLDYFRATGQPVIFIQHLFNNDGYSQSKEELIAVHEGIAPIPGEYIVQKSYPNSFRETTLGQILKYVGVDSVVMTGMMSHMCVDTTVRAAFDLGYQVDLITDGCTTKDLVFGDVIIPAVTAHNAYMAALGSNFANAMTAEEYLKSL